MWHLEKVFNWNDRIKDYPEETKKMYQRILEAEKEYDELLVDKKLSWRLC